ncbi:MAG: hypothetical protein PHF34_07100, partial [Bacteroidales bacterium]|nr:hypothetical protein [Bacteroidales bacterium]
MKKKLFFIVCIFASVMLHATVSKNISITAGGLANALTATERASITDLTVTGTIDARDIKFLRNTMVNLSALNISGVSIKAYTGTDGTDSVYTSYPANEMPRNS